MQSDVKPGWRTTEFWVSLLSMIAPVLIPGVDPSMAVGAISAIGAIYTSARAYTKGKASPQPDATATAMVKQ